MIIVHVVALVVALSFILLVFFAVAYTTVFKDVPASELHRLIFRDMAFGTDGVRSVMYHRRTGTMIQVRKSLSSNGEQEELVGMRVVKTRFPEPKSPYNKERGVLLSPVLWPPVQSAFAWRWDLPSCDDGQILEEVDCGASLSRVKATIERIILEDPALAENPIFDLWWAKSTKGGKLSKHILGMFEDLGEE